MAWKKLGQIYTPGDFGITSHTHASLPVPIHLKDQIYRVLIASRDNLNRSYIYSVDLDLSKNAPRVIGKSSAAILEPGPAGFFDDCGVYPASIVSNGNSLFLYYIGWVAGATSPMFYANVGLAISKDNGKTFEKYSAAPIFGRDSIDPWMVTSPFVIKTANKWKMWYVGGKYWDQTISPWQSYYDIKTAESSDGINWEKLDITCIPLIKGEHHISRLCVVPSAEGFEGWYGVNSGSGYRIGYANSKDGNTWKRLDHKAEIVLSHEGWDSEAQSYPYIIDTKEERFMLYNGNGFGRTGFGVALWQ